MCGKEFGEGAVQIGCPVCDETGQGPGGRCEYCRDGYFLLDHCPREFIGFGFAEAVNLAGMSGGGDWPVTGGLLDQSAWFVNLKRVLDNEQGRIQIEQMERKSGR